MKKISPLLIACILGVSSLHAGIVPKNVAQTVAANCYQQTFATPGLPLTLAYTETSSTGDPVYYAFNVGSNNGFVIVSAEDAGRPIIGYSNMGQYTAPTTNSNADYWMQSRKTEILTLRTKNISATSDISAEWTAYQNNTRPANVARTMHSTSSLFPSATNYLVQTTWNQSPYYNNDCPGGSVTGCVATAMAQIMKYWNYPFAGTGENCYSETTKAGDYEDYGQICANMTPLFSWSTMVNALSSSSTAAQVSNIANLMLDAGVSVDMDYSPSESGAYVTTAQGANSAQLAYVQNFSYYSPTLQAFTYSSYSLGNWEALLESELNNSRPIEYYGFESSGGGHTWVCDGYNVSNNFHMNWGWGGVDDGWYSVTALNVDGYSFNTNLGVLMGIEPSNAPYIDYTTEAPATIYCYTGLPILKALEYYPSATLSWSVTVPVGVTYTITGSTVTFTATSTATGEVSACVTATGPSGFSNASQCASFWVGPPQLAPHVVASKAGGSCYYTPTASVPGGQTYEFSSNSSFTSLLGAASLDPGTKYTIYARAENACGYGPVALTTLTTPVASKGCLYAPVLGNGNGTDVTGDVSIYPNPANSAFKVAIPEGWKSTTIIVMNMEGQTVKTMNTAEQEVTIDSSDLPAGVYIIRITSDNSSSIKKLIIAR